MTARDTPKRRPDLPTDRPGWVSDLLARVLRDLDVRYIANVPGSSYRGLHDSIVNHLGNREPELVLTLHEETAVAVAHGYAKVEERMMAAALHANVGLLRASMAIYDAWCDRAPLLLLGATGPWDAAKRRPIEWLHTSHDQGGFVRAFTKWDDQPASAEAAEESLLRAAQLAQLAPRGPVYVNLDSDVQERALEPDYVQRDARRYRAPSPVHPAPDVVAEAVRMLTRAARPVILMGRCSRRVDDWDARVRLAERLAAPVLTEIRLAAAFPTSHDLHVLPPLSRWTPLAARELLRDADVILALDWPELANTLTEAFGDGTVTARVIHVSCDAHNHRGGSRDHGALAPSDLALMCESDAAVAALLVALPDCADVDGGGRAAQRSARVAPAAPAATQADGTQADRQPLSIAEVGAVLAEAVAGTDVCFTRFPFTWDPGAVHFEHPLDSIGYDGGSGIGSGPGITVGAGLALRGSGRLPIAVLGDGDFIMGNAAIWTAAHHAIPCLFVVCNNRSFYTDERHQAHIADVRGRPRENQWIGARLEQPDIDIAAMARAQGAVGFGPVVDARALRTAVLEGVAAAQAGGPCVIDVLVERPGKEPLPVRTNRQRVAARLRRS